MNNKVYTKDKKYVIRMLRLYVIFFIEFCMSVKVNAQTYT